MSNHISRRHLLVAPMAAGLSSLLGRFAYAQAQDYPSHQINYIVPFAAGGLSDIIARLFGDGVRRHHNQNVIIESKPGAAGTVAVDLFKRANPDGYTLLGVNNGFFAVTPFLYKIKWDPMQDLVPIAMTGDAYMALFVNPSVPANNLRELIAYAKANPDKLNFGSAGLGTVGQLSGEYLKKRAGINMVHIPYKGSPAALQACLANDTQLFFGPEAADAALAGKLKAIAILGPKRWHKLPDVPTVDEQGMPNWGPRSWHAVVVHPRTPLDVQQKLNQLFNRIMSEPAVVEKLKQNGVEPGQNTLAELAERVRVDRVNFGQLIRDLGITAGEPT